MAWTVVVACFLPQPAAASARRRAIAAGRFTPGSIGRVRLGLPAVLALLLAIALAAAPKLPAVPPDGPTAFLWPAHGAITPPFSPGGHPGFDIGILRSLRIPAPARGRG